MSDTRFSSNQFQSKITPPTTPNTAHLDFTKTILPPLFPTTNALSFNSSSFPSGPEIYTSTTNCPDGEYNPNYLPMSINLRKEVKEHICDHPGCNKSYTRKYNLVSHQLSAHTTIRPYPCPSCPATFARPHDLRRHTRSKHTETKPYRCAECNVTFARSDALKRHIDRDQVRKLRGGKSCRELAEFKRVIEFNTIISSRINNDYSSGGNDYNPGNFTPESVHAYPLDEDFDSRHYELEVDNSFIPLQQENTSTFSMRISDLLN